MKKEKNIALLQLFGEEGISGDTSAAGTCAGEIKAGNESSAAGETEDIDAEFASLVAKGGKYASAFKAQMQKAFNKRFAAFKESEASVQRLDSLREAVAKRYSNVDSTDVEALKAAIVNDVAVNSDEVGRYTTLSNFILNAAIKNMTDGFYKQICREESELVEKYKGFNLENEIKNPNFRKMLVEGRNTLEDVYWHFNRENLLRQILSEAKRAALSTNVRKARTVEGAARANIPSTTKIDYRNMSDSEFMALYNKTVRR